MDDSPYENGKNRGRVVGGVEEWVDEVIKRENEEFPSLYLEFCLLYLAHLLYVPPIRIIKVHLISTYFRKISSVKFR